MDIQKVASYQIIPDKRLIIEFLSGNIILEDLINLKLRLVEEKDYNPIYNHILDFREANVSLSGNNIDSYISFIENHEKILATRRSAILTLTPAQVAITTLYIEKGRHLPVNWNIFSTIEAALDWAQQNQLKEEGYEEILSQIRLNNSLAS